MPDKTRAQLLDELALAHKQLRESDELAKEQAEARDRREQQRDPEVRAFEDCARVLGYLEELSRPVSPNRGSSYSTAGAAVYPPSPRSLSTPAERVLDCLRVRLGLPDPAEEARTLAARLRESEQELDRLRGQLANVTAAVTQAPPRWLP